MMIINNWKTRRPTGHQICTPRWRWTSSPGPQWPPHTAAPTRCSPPSAVTPCPTGPTTQNAGEKGGSPREMLEKCWKMWLVWWIDGDLTLKHYEWKVHQEKWWYNWDVMGSNRPKIGFSPRCSRVNGQKTRASWIFFSLQASDSQ